MSKISKNHLLDKLHQGLIQLGESPDSHPCDQYLAYIDLLHEWNRAYNLTAVRDREEMLIRHVLDSLTTLPFIRGRDCLDVATGAGLPGFILALARPTQQWTLLDSNIKKIRFLNQAVLQLKPANIKLVRSRLEDYQPQHQFNTVITRAYTSLKKYHDNAASLVKKNGLLIAMKGGMLEPELKELAGQNIHFDVHEVIPPGINVLRNIVTMAVN